jgi:hypothetical protein
LNLEESTVQAAKTKDASQPMTDRYAQRIAMPERIRLDIERALMQRRGVDLSTKCVLDGPRAAPEPIFEQAPATTRRVDRDTRRPHAYRYS